MIGGWVGFNAFLSAFSGLLSISSWGKIPLFSFYSKNVLARMLGRCALSLSLPLPRFSLQIASLSSFSHYDCVQLRYLEREGAEAGAGAGKKILEVSLSAAPVNAMGTKFLSELTLLWRYPIILFLPFLPFSFQIPIIFA